MTGVVRWQLFGECRPVGWVLWLLKSYEMHLKSAEEVEKEFAGPKVIAADAVACVEVDAGADFLRYLAVGLLDHAASAEVADSERNFEIDFYEAVGSESMIVVVAAAADAVSASVAAADAASASVAAADVASVAAAVEIYSDFG